MCAARGQARAQLDTLQSALGSLETAVRNLAAAPGADTADAARAALGQVKDAGQDLVAAVNQSCPSTSPSPTG